MLSLPKRLGLTREDVVFLPEQDIVTQMDFRFLVHQERLEMVRSWKGWQDGSKVEDFSMLLLSSWTSIQLRTVFCCVGQQVKDVLHDPTRIDRAYRRWWRNQFKDGNLSDP